LKYFRENIMFPRPNAREEQVTKAVKAAYVVWNLQKDSLKKKSRYPIEVASGELKHLLGDKGNV